LLAVLVLAVAHVEPLLLQVVRQHHELWARWKARSEGVGGGGV
jgi:hypothetical protein